MMDARVNRGFAPVFDVRCPGITVLVPGDFRSMKPKTKSRPVKARPHVRLAADIGGTFTDIAVFDDRSGALTFGKTLSTPQRLVDGINAGVEKAGSDYRSAGLFLHGSTIAINTILERTGAKTALLITEGFRDIYEIGRVNRPDSYNLYFSRLQPQVPRMHGYEGHERLYADGTGLKPLDDAEIRSLAETLKREAIEA